MECSSIPTTPDDTDVTSTWSVLQASLLIPQHLTSHSPVLKSQLVSGDYKLIIFGDNGQDGAPYGHERDFHLDVGTQITTTITPTLTLSVTTTPYASRSCGF
jgi:hypothetical protein